MCKCSIVSSYNYKVGLLDYSNASYTSISYTQFSYTASANGILVMTFVQDSRNYRMIYVNNKAIANVALYATSGSPECVPFQLPLSKGDIVTTYDINSYCFIPFK